MVRARSRREFLVLSLATGAGAGAGWASTAGPALAAAPNGELTSLGVR
ncbi:hypothetical protein [Streptomyces sp. NPDC050704]